jgi:transposase-like protein
MSQPDARKEIAKQALLAGETIASIASRLGVSRRTIERWADDGAWREQRASNVVSLPAPKPAKAQKATPCSPEPVPRIRRQRGQIDEIEIVEIAITDLAAAMGAASSEDLRSLGSLAGGLCRLIELRLKLQPRTAAELAEQVLALGVSPAEFINELKQRWAQSA